MFPFSSFVEGFSLGIGAAVPLGPINLLIMNEALKSYKKAVAIGLGAMSADITYLVLILFGVVSFIKNEFVIMLFSLVGGLFLTYLAFLIFKNRDTKVKKVSKSNQGTLISNYIKGYLLTLSNPYTILFWISVTTYATSSSSFVFTLTGMISAILLWITLMPYIVYSKRELISNKLASLFASISSVILLYFAFMLLFSNI